VCHTPALIAVVGKSPTGVTKLPINVPSKGAGDDVPTEIVIVVCAPVFGTTNKSSGGETGADVVVGPSK
jgi:hypothetical protein